MFFRYIIIEKNSEVGGTWFDNIYPGVGCDVKSHLYSFSSAINPNWTQHYSKGPEILEYIKELARPIRDKIQFNTSVVSATWKANACKWNMELSTGEDLEVDVVITATGLLHKPLTPRFPGAELYQGISFHTNRWDNSVNLAGKNIGIIGTGASAVQAVPKIADMGVKSLTVFQRTATWCITRSESEISELLKNLFRFLPLINIVYRWWLFVTYEVQFFIIFMMPSKLFPVIGKVHSFLQNRLHNYFRKNIRDTVVDQKVASKLIPSAPLGCKRITPNSQYLNSFNKKNVHLVTEPITSLNKNGIITADNTSHNLDVIIFATGFDLVGSANAFNVRGVRGASLAKCHADAPQAYLGVTHHLCPNYFMIGGPGTVLGHNSVIFIMECQIKYIKLALEEMLLKKAKCVLLKAEAMDTYQSWAQHEMKNKVFEGDKYCTGWYRNSRGVNWTFWPSHLLCYWWSTLGFDSKNYIFT